MKDVAQIIGKRLAVLRDESGFTQEEIQKLTGINRTTYSKNESGKAAPSLANLRIFSKLYGVSLDFLCDIDDRNKVTLYDSSKNMTKEEKMLVSYYRLMDEDSRKELLEKLEKEAVETVSK